MDDLGVEKGLAAREANAADTGTHEPVHHRNPCAQVESRFGVYVAIAPVGAAVHARKIAPIGQRQAHRAGGGRRRRGFPRIQDRQRIHGRRILVGRGGQGEPPSRKCEQATWGATGFAARGIPVHMTEERKARAKIRVLTITMSDTRKRANDESGRVLVETVLEGGLTHVRHVILREEPQFLQELVRTVASENQADCVIINGGTGITPRDRTFEALDAIFEKRIIGFGEAFRRLSWDQIGPHSILSRASAGVVDGCVVFSLPGSVRAVKIGVAELILPVIEHAVGLALGHSTHVPANPPPSAPTL